MLAKFFPDESPQKITKYVNGKTIDKVMVYKLLHETYTVIFFTDGTHLKFQGINGWGFFNS